MIVRARALLLPTSQPVGTPTGWPFILIALIEHRGKLISKNELMAKVWPDTFVEPANLTVHIAAFGADHRTRYSS